MNNNTIAIYRDKLLPPSETFILSQRDSLTNYQSYYIGSKKVDGLEISDDSSFVINNGGYYGLLCETFFKLSRYSKRLDNFLKQYEPTLIHAHFGPDALLVSPLAKKNNVPLLTTFHGYDITIKDKFAKKSFYVHRKFIKHKNELMKGGTAFIAVSNFIKEKLIEEGFSENKIFVHYIGIDTQKFKPIEDLERESTVLFVGRLVEKKGCEYLIKAMEEVQKVNPEVRLVIIGDGPQREKLERAAKEKLINYQFLGFQSQSNVKKWMNKSKVFCTPSITAENGDTEAFGLVFAEAQAMGLPVVSFNSGGISEVVSHENTGFLANEKDWLDLSKYILRLFNDEDLWHQFSGNGIKHINENFDLKTQTGKLEDIYSKIIKEYYK
ncbi:glycosyltransferase [Rossellomorea sp. NPDC077527]|uniref:glycosyltransferase n=1 Tax=Rossellomorea sp. NPDC077527 TaxID=3364510 RepID=UPI0037C87BC9